MQNATLVPSTEAECTPHQPPLPPGHSHARRRIIPDEDAASLPALLHLMNEKPASLWTRLLARVCCRCPVCQRARRQPNSLAHQWVAKVEGWLCPFCRAYRRLYGRRSSEPQP